MQEPETLTENPLGTQPIGRLVFRFALPSTLALVVNALYNMVDQIFIGQGVGYLGNAATNIIFPLTVIMLAIANLWGDGCAAHTSLMLGEKKPERASYGVCNAFLVSLIMGLALMAVSLIFLTPVCRLFGATETVLPYAIEYGRIVAIGFPFVGMLVPLTTNIRADGSPVYSMISLIAGCVSNVALDAWFVLGLGWGVRGAAIATVLGELISALIALSYFPRFQHVFIKRKYFALQSDILRRMAGLGVSSCILQLSIALIVIVSNNMLALYGKLTRFGSDIPVAAMGVTMKLYQVAINIVQGICTGTLPIMGYNYGAKKYDRTKRAFWIALIASTICMVVATLLFQLAPMSLISLFGSESDVYNEFSVMCLRIYLMFCAFNGVQLCASIFFQSVGKPGLASANTFIKQIVLVPVGMVVLSAIIGLNGTLWAGPVADCVSFVIAIILLRRNWKRIFPSETAPDA